MKHKFFHSLTAFAVLLLLASCFSRDSKPKNSSSASLDVPQKGVTIEASYDPRLNNLIPGYKIITIALTNNGVDVLKLDPLRDRWEIVDAYGKTRRAINSIRIKDPNAWSRLPTKVKDLIEYPVGVSINYSETIDLFFSSNLDLTAFRSISFYCAQRNEKYDMLTNLNLENQQPMNPPEATPPPQAAPSKKKSMKSM